MADCILIPLQNVGCLALTREEFETALVEGAKRTGVTGTSSCAETSEALLDADQAGAQLGITSRWLEDSARAGIVPHYKLGRFLRFRVSEIATHCRVAGAPQSTSAVIPQGQVRRFEQRQRMST